MNTQLDSHTVAHRLLALLIPFILRISACSLPGQPGALDPSFDPGNTFCSGGFASVTSIAIQNNGQVLVGGDFRSATTFLPFGLARLWPDGTIDTNYVPPFPQG